MTSALRTSLLPLLTFACLVGCDGAAPITPPPSEGSPDASVARDAALDAALQQDADGGPADAAAPDAAAPEPPCMRAPSRDDPPVDGEVIVRIEDGPTGGPIADAIVQVRVADLDLSGVTDEQGCVVLRDVGLRAPFAIDVFAADYEAMTAIGFERSRIDVALEPSDYTRPDPNARTPGTLTGRVTNLDLVGTTTDATHARYATVGQIVQYQDTAALPQAARPSAAGYRANTVVQGAGRNFPTFELSYAPNRGRGVFVVGGTHTPPPNAPGAFIPTHLGYVATASVTWGATRNLDVTLTHALDQTMVFDVRNPPPLDFVGVRMQVNVPDVGFINLGGAYQAPWPYTAPAPAFTGELATAYPAGVGLAYTSDQLRTSERLVPGRAGSTVVVLDQWLTPATGFVVSDGQLVASDLGGGANYCEFIVYDLASRRSFWRARHLAQSPGRVAIPSFPAALGDPLRGRALDVTMYCYRAPGWEPGGAAAFADLIDAVASTSGRATF